MSYLHILISKCSNPLRSLTVFSLFPLTHNILSRHWTHPTRTTEVYMYWWKSAQHSCQNSNQVRPVWYLPPRRQNWIEGQDHSPQKPQWCWTNQHRNPPGMADWKRQEASDVDNPCWGLTWHWTFCPCWWDWGSQMSTRPVSKDMLVLFCYVKRLQFCFLCCCHCHRCEVCMCYHLPNFLISRTSECHFMFVVLLLTQLLPSPSKLTHG